MSESNTTINDISSTPTFNSNMKKHQEEGYAIDKERLETHYIHVEICAKLIQIFQDQDDKDSYQKLLDLCDDSLLEDFQRLFSHVLTDGTLFEKARLHYACDDMKEFLEMSPQSANFQMYKLLYFIKGPSILSKRSPIQTLSESQNQMRKKINDMKKRMVMYENKPSFPEKEANLLTLMIEELDHTFMESLDWEQRIYDTLQELYHVDTLKEANLLIDELFNQLEIKKKEWARIFTKHLLYVEPMRTDTSSYSLINWLEQAQSILESYTGKYIEQCLLSQSKCITRIKCFHIAGCMFFYLMVVYVLYLYLSYVDFFPWTLYGSCKLSDGNIVSMLNNGFRLYYTNKHLLVYGKYDFWRFFARFFLPHCVAYPFYRFGYIAKKRENLKIIGRLNYKEDLLVFCY